jgi:hypothetical protein
MAPPDFGVLTEALDGPSPAVMAWVAVVVEVAPRAEMAAESF